MPLKKSKSIIFVHGWASGPYVWLNQASYFKDKHKVHTPELINYNNIKDFILKQESDDICLVGWSLGGIVSLKLAGELKGKIKHLVLISSTPCFVSSADFECAISRDVVEKIYTRMQSDAAGTLHWFYKFCFSPNERSRGGYAEIIKIAGDFMAPVALDTLLGGLKFLMDTDVRAVLGTLDMPVLVIHGAQDRVCPPQAAEFMAKNIKKSTMHIIENAGHAPLLTEPDKVNNLIKKFIS